MIEYSPIENFQQIIDMSKSLIHGEKYRYNFMIGVSFDIRLVQRVQIQSHLSWAEKFQQINKPDDLYVNHGEYIGDEGIRFVIEELKRKPKSNRAMISLISQQHIVRSGDDPIPSFNIVQFGIEDKQLYITVYFRALEVSTFLKINLEEIRLITHQIQMAIRGLEQVNLLIHSFRGYILEDINTLVRPKIEQLKETHLLRILETDIPKLLSMLREKHATYSTVVDNQSLYSIKANLTDEIVNQNINPRLKDRYVLDQLDECISLDERLKELRKGTSHDAELDETHRQFKDSLEKLIGAIEQCL
ncbi:hypothetical protein A8L34_25795 [Bacillus sp. FJAT-27264]|uniref:hypothetical protein n=1 Tax=Paenibacillus sp. (strain DSM 101736 / FJAT-27264) TaxID=1850362 RepID=UPI000807C16D|nr:hypothetical protein [Bacillus sp. FJAT-27264]OBZ07550.1 hypothetical protein A8L34_25795 [Bacillus sp. FJAT-27264]